MNQPFDPGLQAERTSLSWLRTSLSLVVAGVFVIRISVPEAGLLGAIIGLIGVLFAFAAAIISGGRYRRATHQLQANGNLRTDGRVIALASASAVALGLIAATFALRGVFS